MKDKVIKYKKKIFILILPLFLWACSSVPSEADGWEYDNYVEGYHKTLVYSENDDITKEILKVYQGTWTSAEDPEVAIIIKNEKVEIGLHTDYETFPVKNFELQSSEWAFESNDYEPSGATYNLIMEVPTYFSSHIKTINMIAITSDSGMLIQPDYAFTLLVGIGNNQNAFYTMKKSSIIYSSSASYSNNGEESSVQATKKIKEKEKFQESNQRIVKEFDELKSKRRRSAKLAEKKKEREQETLKRNKREAKRKEARKIRVAKERKKEVEEQRKQDEKRQKEEENLIEKQKLDEIQLIKDIINKKTNNFLQEEYEFEIKNYGYIDISIIPNDKAFNGNFEDFVTGEQFDKDTPSEEWKNLTSSLIDVYGELSELYPGEEIELKLTNTSGYIGYLIIREGKVYQDFPHGVFE